MSESHNLWAQEAGKSTNSPSSYLSVMHEIHILLVDHDSEDLISIAKLLELCQFRVTIVEQASTAIRMLLTGKVNFDIVMANADSPNNNHCFKLSQQAASMDVPVVLMSDEENVFVAMRALESGASLCIKKPTTTEMLRCMWQYVARKIIPLKIEKERPQAANSIMHMEFRGKVNVNDENPNNIKVHLPDLNLPIMDQGISNESNYEGGNTIGGEAYKLENHTSNGNIKSKKCTKWTRNLHDKFMDAVEILGEGRCFPKEIHELMNVSGLTTKQVSSHLAKCRKNKCHLSKESKSGNETKHASFEPNNTTRRYRPTRFGSMPKLGKEGPSKATGGATVKGDCLNKPSQSKSKTQNNGSGNMEIEAPSSDGVIMNENGNNAVHDQPYGPTVPHNAR